MITRPLSISVGLHKIGPWEAKARLLVHAPIKTTSGLEVCASRKTPAEPPNFHHPQSRLFTRPKTSESSYNFSTQKPKACSILSSPKNESTSHRAPQISNPRTTWGPALLSVSQWKPNTKEWGLLAEPQGPIQPRSFVHGGQPVGSKPRSSTSGHGTVASQPGEQGASPHLESGSCLDNC